MNKRLKLLERFLPTLKKTCTINIIGFNKPFLKVSIVRGVAMLKVLNLYARRDMREIKFRAWVDKSRMIFSKDTYGNYLDFFTICRQCNDGFGNCYLMQFTGLLDKNGKEIYEGDILRWHLKKGRVFSEISEQDDPLAQLLGVKPGEVSEDTICTDTVEFHDGCFFLMCPDTGGGAFLNRENENAEIIGNIYENPELLKRHC